MRITPQQIQVQLNQIKTSAKGMNVSKGDMIKGKILEIQANTIVLQLGNGEVLRAEVQHAERFVEGEQLQFQVEDTKGEMVQLEIVTDEKVSLGTEAKLKAVDIEVSKENVKAFEVLKALDLPVSKETIKNMVQQFKQLSTLNTTLQVKPQMIEGQYINDVQPQVSNEAGVTIEKTGQTLEVLSKALNIDVETLKTMDVKKIVIELLKLDQPVEVKMSPENITKETGLVTQNKLTQLADVLTLPLDLEDTMDKLATLTKLNKPVTINHLSILNKLSLENEKIDAQLKVLIDTVPKDRMSAKLLSLVKGFNVQDLKTEGEVKQYFNELLIELETLEASEKKPQIQQLIQTVNFLEQDSNDVAWIQMPIQMGSQLETLDIMVKQDKSSNKGISKDHAKILVALDTEYLDHVQALIHVDKEKLNIDFTVIDERIKSIFTQELSALKEAFEETFNEVKLNVKNKEPMSFKSFVNEAASDHINIIV